MKKVFLWKGQPGMGQSTVTLQMAPSPHAMRYFLS